MSSLALRLSFVLLGAIPWTAALYGALQMHQLDLHLGHNICGPWGCGPPTEALIGYHTFWLVLMLPLAITAGVLLPNAASRRLGFALLALGLLAIVGYVSWDASRYVAQANSIDYLWQRCLFVLATTVDLPMMQLSLMGLIIYSRGIRAQIPTGSVDLESNVHSDSSDPVAPMQTRSKPR